MKKTITVSTISNYAVTCLNRDRNGVPKTAIYGGTERGRVSSQCRKYWLRRSEGLGELILSSEEGKELQKVATQTRHVCKALSLLDETKERLAGLGDEFVEQFESILDSKEVKLYTKTELIKMMDVLEKWIEEMGGIDVVIDFAKWYHANEKPNGDFEKPKGLEKDEQRNAQYNQFKKFQSNMVKCENTDISIDIACFGRMSAAAGQRVDGAVCMGHGITTHEVDIQSDFFSAVDMLMPVGGSGHINSNDFLTGCFYQCMSIDTEKLIKSLEQFGYVVDVDATAKAIVKAVIKAFILESSESRQNSMASHPFPAVVLIDQIDTKHPFDYAAAFEKAVERSDEGYLVPSIKRLKDEVEMMSRKFDILNIEHDWFCTKGIDIDEKYGKNCETLSELMDCI